MGMTVMFASFSACIWDRKVGTLTIISVLGIRSTKS